jgi:quercetin dioxygenase-like cupin family protein
MSTQISAQAPYVLAAGEGKPLAWFDATIILKASSPQLGATEVVIKPGEEPPMHVHKNEDEWFYLIRGEVTFHVGGQSHLGTAGAFVSFPRGIAHTFTVESTSAHFIVLNTPGGFERMFEMAPKNNEEAARAMQAVGIEIVGPNPRYAKAA